MKSCTTRNCHRPAKAKGLCINCYNKKRYKTNKEKQMSKRAYGIKSSRPKRMSAIAKSMGITIEELLEKYNTGGRI